MKRWRVVTRTTIAICLVAQLTACSPQPSSQAQKTSSQKSPSVTGSGAESDQAIAQPQSEPLAAAPEPSSNPSSIPSGSGPIIVLGEQETDTSYSSSNSSSNEPTVVEGIKLDTAVPSDSTASATSEASEPAANVVSDSTTTFGNVATEAERNQKIAEDWPQPQVVIYVSGQQQGYIEPCGCTGLEQQKGGLIRRDTVISQLRERGWQVLPVDVGNQNRRHRSAGPQPQIKFATTAKALQQMDYQAVALGVHDLELSRVELLQLAGSSEGSPRPFICANVAVLVPDFFPPYKIVEAGGRKIGITSVIGRELEQDVKKDPRDDEVEFSDPVERLQAVVPELKSKGCDFVILLAHTSLEESAQLGKLVEGIDLIITAGGFGEPTLNAEAIEGSKSVMVQVGTKGMYGGIIGLFADQNQPMRYQKIAISSQFPDSTRILKLFAEYQDRLQEAGFSGLGLTPAKHPSGRDFVGSDSCGECHTEAFKVWENTPHFHATDSIVAPNNDRGGIARHFDPECVSCHVTGWNPQKFTPFETGYESLEKSAHLLGSGCENCHGPGSAHVQAENGDIDTTPALLEQLREEMRLPLAKAEAKCIECHDMDNSPDFHLPGAFEKYWDRVKHYGKN